MLLSFEVNVAGDWTPATRAAILADGRLGYLLPDGTGGVARPPYWRHTETTTSQPAFRRLCFDAMTPEERQCATSRLGGPPVF